MDVTEVGMVILVNEAQPKNAEAPMDVTEVGMVILVNEVQPEKANVPIEITVYIVPLILIMVGMEAVTTSVANPLTLALPLLIV